MKMQHINLSVYINTKSIIYIFENTQYKRKKKVNLPFSIWGKGGAVKSLLYISDIWNVKPTREWKVGCVGCCKKKWPAVTVADNMTSNEEPSGSRNCKRIT